MKSIRSVLMGTMLAGGAMLAAGGLSSASAADETPADASAPAGMHGPGRHGGELGHLYRKLGLTSAQQASMKTIMTAARPQMKTLHEQMKANHLKLMQTKPDDPNYSNVVAEVAQSNATLASQRTTQGAALSAQLYAVLTPAQKTQLATLEAEWEANPHHGHWGERGSEPDGAAAGRAGE